MIEVFTPDMVDTQNSFKMAKERKRLSEKELEATKARLNYLMSAVSKEKLSEDELTKIDLDIVFLEQRILFLSNAIRTEEQAWIKKYTNQLEIEKKNVQPISRHDFKELESKALKLAKKTNGIISEKLTQLAGRRKQGFKDDIERGYAFTELKNAVREGEKRVKIDTQT